MLAYTYVEPGLFELRDKPNPVLLDDRDAIVRVSLCSISSSDLHKNHGSDARPVYQPHRFDGMNLSFHSDRPPVLFVMSRFLITGSLMCPQMILAERF